MPANHGLASVPDLAQLQRWMLAVITFPGGAVKEGQAIHARAGDEEAIRHPTDVVIGTEGFDSLSRLAIYSHAYIARLLEVLQGEFPALHHALGPDLFTRFATDYLHASPPQSDTLGVLGAGWPDYLEQTRPPRETPQENADHTANWIDFLIDLARLERVYAEVFDGPGLEKQPGLQLSDLATVSAEEWPELTFTLNPSLVLLKLQFPVHEYISAVRRQQSPDIPVAGPTWLVVCRQNYVVRRISVSQAEFAALSSLKQGDPVGWALAAAEQFLVTQPHVMNAEIERWFQRWGQAGYFQGVSKKSV